MATQNGQKRDGEQQAGQVLSRRAFLRAAWAGAGAVALAACGATSGSSGGGAAPAAGTSAPAAQSAAPTTLEFWAFADLRTTFVKEVLASEEWKSAHPDVTVNYSIFSYNEMHDKLLAALAAGTGAPDIADVEISRFSRFIKGERVGFVPLNDRIGSEIDNLYTGAATAPWSWQEQIYGLGNELNTVAFAYRKDILDGLGIATPFATWDDVRAAGQKVAEGGTSQLLAIHDIAWGDWYIMAQHAGTTLFDAEGNYNANSEKGVAAMQFLHGLVYTDKIAGIAPSEADSTWTPPSYYAAFNADKFLAFWGAPWHFGGFIANSPDLSGKWAAQTLPSGLGDSIPTANFGGTGQCITEQSRNPDLAWEILKAANLSVAGALADFKARTVYPSYKPAYADPALQGASEYFGGAKMGELYASVAGQLPAFRQSPFWPEATDAMERIVITPVMQDQTDAVTALNELGAEIERLKQQG